VTQLELESSNAECRPMNLVDGHRGQILLKLLLDIHQAQIMVVELMAEINGFHVIATPDAF
jgi:hypothetical protein